MPPGQVLDYVRRCADGLQTINEIYVVGDDKKLRGMATLRRVLTAPDEQPMQELMGAEPVSVSPETDQQEAARLISRFELLTLPVTDSAGAFSSSS